jgi:LuxR family maltose regulon positive regulatory protein
VWGFWGYVALLRPLSIVASLRGGGILVFPVLSGVIDRARLLDRIESPSLAHITLITAPAGYGKTTLAYQWTMRHPSLGCGWYRVQAEHDAPATFLRQLWHAVDTAAGEHGDPPTEVTVQHLLDRLRMQPAPIMLVLDDYHVVENKQIHRAVDQLFRGLPDHVHFILLSRNTPRLSLARLRTTGQVRQLTQADLAFTVDEVEQFFAAYALSGDFLTRLTDATEGWIAGLQLSKLAMDATGQRAPVDIDQFIATLPDNRLFHDYFIEEVLDPLPEDLRRFVLDAVFLERLEPDLCNAVLEIDTSERLLDQLEDRGVFVWRSGGIGTALTFHLLFAQCVQRLRRLAPGGMDENELRLRSAQWHRERGELREAVNVALAAEAWSFAAELMREFLPASTVLNQPWEAYAWLCRLPEPYLTDDPELNRSYLNALLLTGRFDRARPFLEAEPGPDPIAQGWHANQRALLAHADGNRSDALFQSHQALSLLPSEIANGRLLAWSNIFREECARGNREVAYAALNGAELARQRHARELPYWRSYLVPEIANESAIRGDLIGAETLARHFLDELPPYFDGTIGHIKSLLLSLYLEQERLDLVGNVVADVERSLQEQDYRIWYVDAFTALAEYYLACDEPDRAWELLDQSLTLTRRYGGYALIRKAEASAASFWLRTGRHQLAQLWTLRTGLEPHLSWTFGGTEPRLVRIGLLMRNGQALEAKALLEESLSLARHQGHVAAEIALLVWSSVVSGNMEARSEADAALRKALELGAPGRFVRVFRSTGSDLSDEIRRLLPTLSDDARRHAVSMVGEPAPVVQPEAASPLSEAGLTQREQEVLAELVLGKSNREISESLYISERTVKKHLANLFRKTGTSNRIAVAMWGRERMPGRSTAFVPPASTFVARHSHL